MQKTYRVVEPIFGIPAGTRFKFDSEAASDREREMHASLLRQRKIEWLRDDRGEPDIRGGR